MVFKFIDAMLHFLRAPPELLSREPGDRARAAHAPGSGDAEMHPAEKDIGDGLRAFFPHAVGNLRVNIVALGRYSFFERQIVSRELEYFFSARTVELNKMTDRSGMHLVLRRQLPDGILHIFSVPRGQ